MFEARYGKEPFDLRLTVLRLIRNIHIILSVTALGTLIFGGGYYVKNILLVTEHNYEATSTYKVEYTDEPSKSGDYYINEMSWNTYVQSGEFLEALMAKMDEMGVNRIGQSGETQIDQQELAGMLSATLASDIHVPSVTVTTGSADLSLAIERAVEETMMGDFAESNPQIREIKVIDQAAQAVEVEPDVRPVRAVILSAVLSCFFAVAIFLIYEIGNDGIWLPACIRSRYGLKCVGTEESRELWTNIEYIFGGMKKVAVCTAEEDADPKAVADMLRTILSGESDKECAANDGQLNIEWIPVPTPALCPESARCMREADGVLLCLNAGSHAGKRLERVQEFLREQDISITAVILNNADEWLIRVYYLIPKNAGESAVQK